MERMDAEQRTLDDPFPEQRISEKTVFLWSEMTSPLPWASTGGDWGHCQMLGMSYTERKHIFQTDIRVNKKRRP
jgi:hypothetical protein